MTNEQKSVVLIVDDSATGRETLAEALETEGYELHQAAGGAEALDQAVALKPDVVLLDVMMPGMDGFEVCRRLRADPALADAPVLMVTAMDDRSSRLKGLEAGADDFITKPFDRAELRARLRTVTRLNRYRKLRDEHARLQQEMAEREKLQTQFLRAQKMEAIGRLAGGVAHDFNNNLTVILGRTELALAQVDKTNPLYANLEEIRDATQRSADLTRQLLAFARKQTIAPRALDLNVAVTSMLKLLRRLIGADIDLACRPDANPGTIHMDPSQVDQILANLCVNARDAIVGNGKVSIATANTTLDEADCACHADSVPGEYVLLTVSDNGCGMDQETLGKIFDPFFTSKEPGKGTGLGLATVYGIIRQNNGFINVCSEPGQGTTFRIYLPLHASMVVPEAGEYKLPAEAYGCETILLVEDEPAILKMAMKMLEQLGYTVLAAHTPGEAIHLAREHAGRIHLVVTDMVMPEMNGRDLVQNLLSIYPDIKRLFISGYTADVIDRLSVLDEDVHLIQKPFSLKDLTGKIREALAAPI